MIAVRIVCDLLVIASSWKHDVEDSNSNKANKKTNAFTLLKKTLDQKVGLHTLVYTRIPDRERTQVLQSIAAASPATKQELIILCDIDDTFMCSLLDRRYPHGIVYPGLLQFYRELSIRDFRNDAESPVRSDSAMAMTWDDVADPLDSEGAKVTAADTLVALSANPKNVLKSSALKSFKTAGDDVGPVTTNRSKAESMESSGSNSSTKVALPPETKLQMSDDLGDPEKEDLKPARRADTGVTSETSTTSGIVQTGQVISTKARRGRLNKYNSAPVTIGSDNSLYNQTNARQRTSRFAMEELKRKSGNGFQRERTFKQYESEAPEKELSVTFLTARPGMLRKMTEEQLMSHGIDRPVLLMGSWKNLAGHARMASKKIKNQLQYFDLWPEMYFVFLGDNGQGDVDVGQELLHYEQIKDVFIHNISQGESERSAISRMLHFRQSGIDISITSNQDTTSTTSVETSNKIGGAVDALELNMENEAMPGVNGRNVKYMKTYLGAALHAARSNLVSEDGLARVAAACVDDLMKVKFPSAKMRKNRVLDLHADFNSALKEYPRVAEGVDESFFKILGQYGVHCEDTRRASR